MTPIDLLILGAGNRGARAYGAYALAHPDEFRVVGIAEPNAVRRERMGADHAIPAERQFARWEDALALPRFARAVVVTTHDTMHVNPTVAALEAGYDVLLEKPMAQTAADCRLLVEAAERSGRLLQVCHVLRYTPFFSALREIVSSGRLGDIVTIEYRENASYWHMAHSFVRGSWGNTAKSSPMILAKSCHDLDILLWVMGRPATRLSSFGSLMHFRADQAPAGAPARCLDGCPAANTCAWYAPRVYSAEPGWSDPPATPAFMLGALEGGATAAERRETLRTSPYGRCVYHCDNDVVDHQVVAMEFEGGATCAFTMHGHSDREGRTLRFDGTQATLYGEFGYGGVTELRIHPHGGGPIEVIRPDSVAGGHGGGDDGLMADFGRALHGESSPQRTTARASLASHLLAFAAEASRLSGQVVDPRLSP